MNVLLTGFSGTLGSAVTKKLIEKKHNLRVLLHGTALNSRTINPDVKIVWGSLSQLDLFDQLMKDIDVVIHCAWENRNQFEGMTEKVNLHGTVRLIESAQRNNVKTFIHVSSVGVYGLDRSIWNKEIGETHPLVSKSQSLNPYPWTKVLIEDKCFELSEKLDMNLIIIRPGLLFSENKAPSKKLIDFKNKKYAIIVGSGKNHLPYIHVNDVAEMILKIMCNPSKYDVYNCVPTMCLPLGVFLKKWARYYGYSMTILRLPPLVFRLLNWLIRKLKQVMRRQIMDSSVDYQILTGIRDIKYSACKSVKNLGWQDSVTKAIAMKY